jgi:hypothetical protein
MFIGEVQVNFDGYSLKHTLKPWQLLGVHPRITYKHGRFVYRRKSMLYNGLNMKDEEFC